jgi:hypothetical protein
MKNEKDIILKKYRAVSFRRDIRTKDLLREGTNNDHCTSVAYDCPLAEFAQRPVFMNLVPVGLPGKISQKREAVPRHQKDLVRFMVLARFGLTYPLHLRRHEKILL